MLQTDRQLCEFAPRGLLEALSWYWSCGDYTLREALRRAPIELGPGSIRRCRRVDAPRFSRRPDEYVVDFTLTARNRVVVARLPPGFPADMVECGDTPAYLRELVVEQLVCIPRGLSAWWLAASALSVVLLDACSPRLAWIFQEAATSSCGAACAAAVARGRVLDLSGLVPGVLALLLPAMFGGRVLSRTGISPAMRAMTRTELVILPIVGAVLTGLMLARL